MSKKDRPTQKKDNIPKIMGTKLWNIKLCNDLIMSQRLLIPEVKIKNRKTDWRKRLTVLGIIMVVLAILFGCTRVYFLFIN